MEEPASQEEYVAVKQVGGGWLFCQCHLRLLTTSMPPATAALQRGNKRSKAASAKQKKPAASKARKASSYSFI